MFLVILLIIRGLVNKYEEAHIKLELDDDIDLDVGSTAEFDDNVEDDVDSGAKLDDELEVDGNDGIVVGVKLTFDIDVELDVNFEVRLEFIKDSFEINLSDAVNSICKLFISDDMMSKINIYFKYIKYIIYVIY